MVSNDTCYLMEYQIKNMWNSILEEKTCLI